MSGRRQPGPDALLTDEVRELIVRHLESGSSLEVAARAAGVARRTLQRWLAAGEEAEAAAEVGSKLSARERAYLELREAAGVARARAQVRALATIQKAGLDGSWQAAAWFLERVFPEEFSARRQREKGAGGRPLGATSAPDRRPGLRAVK